MNRIKKGERGERNKNVLSPSSMILGYEVKWISMSVFKEAIEKRFYWKFPATPKESKRRRRFCFNSFWIKIKTVRWMKLSFLKQENKSELQPEISAQLLRTKRICLDKRLFWGKFQKEDIRIYSWMFHEDNAMQMAKWECLNDFESRRRTFVSLKRNAKWFRRKFR